MKREDCNTFSIPIPSLESSAQGRKSSGESLEIIPSYSAPLRPNIYPHTPQTSSSLSLLGSYSPTHSFPSHSHPLTNPPQSLSKEIQLPTQTNPRTLLQTNPLQNIFRYPRKQNHPPSEIVQDGVPLRQLLQNPMPQPPVWHWIFNPPQQRSRHLPRLN